MKKEKSTVATEQPSNRPGNQATSYNEKTKYSNLALAQMLKALPPADQQVCVVLGNMDAKAVTLLTSSEKISEIYIVGPNWKHPDATAVVRVITLSRNMRKWPVIATVDNFLKEMQPRSVDFYYLADPIYNKHTAACYEKAKIAVAGIYLTDQVSGCNDFHHNGFTHHDLTWHMIKK